jgi:NADH dehydrogenase
MLKEFFCKGAVKQLADEARKPGSSSWWVKDHKRQQLLQARRGGAVATAERPA